MTGKSLEAACPDVNGFTGRASISERAIYLSTGACDRRYWIAQEQINQIVEQSEMPVWGLIAPTCRGALLMIKFAAEAVRCPTSKSSKCTMTKKLMPLRYGHKTAEAVLEQRSISRASPAR